jgi:hypothetical protein
MKYEGIHASLLIEQPAAGVVLVRLTGWDVGEFGDAPLKELDRLLGEAPLQLFIDARRVKGASIDVSSEWAQWLRRNRQRLAHVSMLTGAPFVQLTAKFVQRFADLGEVMRIYTDAGAFDAALASTTQMRKMGSVPI